MADNVIVRVPEQQFIKGEDGYSPEVTIENIDHGHSITITDREHQEEGQTFNVLDGDSAYEQAVAGGYTGTEAQFNEELASFKELSEQAADSANTAAGAAFRAQNYERHAGDAEDAARAYADIALIRMNSADQSAQSAAGSASNASRDAGTASTAATTATTKAGEASDSATAADGSAKDSEAYAIGKRGGTDVGSTDPAYHNNAKYYAQQASGSASDAATAKGAAETAQGLAESAQTAAETAQAAAEDAQEAAEAVLASIPADYSELSEDVDDLKSAFNADLFANRYLKYNGLTKFSFGATSGRPAFSRYGNTFFLNGNVTSANFFIKLTEAGSSNTSTSRTSISRNWPMSVQFEAGHTYKGILALISGTYNGDVSIEIINSSAAYTTFNIGETVFTPGEMSACVALHCVSEDSFDNALFSFTIEDITEEGLTTYSKSVVGAINELNENTQGLAYSWWVNNTATDSYGTVYFGYISDSGMVGVGCRYADGTTKRHDLFASEDNDDHNAPSVIIIPIDDQEHVCVIGSTGHNTDSKINVFVADEPNTIDCTFTDKTHTITAPTGYKYQCSYSQAYYDSANSAIINFFRLKQINSSDSTFHMVWMCAKSTDNGDTWSIYRVFTITEDGVLFYMFSANTKSSHIMRMILQVNTTYSQYKPLKAGLINTKSGNIFNNAMTNIQKPMTLVQDGELVYTSSIVIANYDDFTTMVEMDDNKHFRILDVFTTAASSNKACFLYAKSVESSTTYRDLIHWDLYRNYNGTTVKVGELGIPFFYGSLYVTGASFIGDVDHVVYCKNDSTVQDYLHSMHLVALENNAVTSDSIIKRAARTLARPKRYDNGSIMYLIGKYREGAGTKYLTWHFSIGFMDSI